MRGTIHMTTVEGKNYKYWSDFMARATFAEDEDGIVKRVHGNGYITKDLTARKAIAAAFGHESFRK